MNSDFNEGVLLSCKAKEDKNMNKLEETLWKDYEAVSDLIKVLEGGDEGKRNVLLEERDKIRNEILKLEQCENDRIMKREEIIHFSSANHETQ